MAEDLQELVSKSDLTLRPGTSLAAIRDREAELGVTFPDDYVELMLLSNGLEGFMSSDPDSPYIQIDPIEEVMDDEAEQLSGEFRPRFVVFGSDGGGEAFAFDADHDMRIVMFPWVGGAEDAIVQAPTLGEFLLRGPVFES